MQHISFLIVKSFNMHIDCDSPSICLLFIPCSCLSTGIEHLVILVISKSVLFHVSLPLSFSGGPCHS